MNHATDANFRAANTPRPVWFVPAHRRAKEKSRVNIRMSPNFLAENRYFWGKLLTFFFRIFRNFRSSCRQNFLRNWKRDFDKFSPKFVTCQREFGNVWGLLKRFSLARSYIPRYPLRASSGVQQKFGKQPPTVGAPIIISSLYPLNMIYIVLWVYKSFSLIIK